MATAKKATKTAAKKAASKVKEKWMYALDGYLDYGNETVYKSREAALEAAGEEAAYALNDGDKSVKVSLFQLAEIVEFEVVRTAKTVYENKVKVKN